MAVRRHAGDHRIHDLAHDARPKRGIDERARRERAHPAGVRPAVFVEDALVILSRSDGQRTRAVADDEERDFGTGQTLLHHQPIARRAKPSIAHRRDDRGLGGRPIVRDDDALSRRETVGLEHDRESEFIRSHARERIVERRRGVEARRGDIVTRHERFGEHLARFERGRRARGSEQQPSVGGKAVGDADTQRQLGPDDRQIDLFTRGEREDGIGIGQVGGDGARDLRDARIAWCADHFSDVTFDGETGRQRVLARAAPEHEHVHRHGRVWRLEPYDSKSVKGCAADAHRELRPGLFR